MKKAKTKDITFRTILIMSLGVTVLFNLIFLISFFFSEGLMFPHADSTRPPFVFLRFIDGFLQMLVFSFLLYALCLKGHKLNFKKKTNRYLLVILGSIIITLIISFLSIIPPALFSEESRDILIFIVRNSMLRNFSVMTIILISWQLLITERRRQDMLLENEALVNENIRTRFESLKNQMNPHFLFNSLNTLQVLIGSDDDKARDYVMQLSQVLRHSLQNKEVVTLNEELGFTEAYCKLMKVRYGDNLNFEISISDRYSDHLIMPLSLQVLIENCIKHNVISTKQPLTISIVTDEADHITVSNNMQPRIDREEGNGIGLFNLAERYRLMWGMDIDIKEDGQKFEVTLTLVKS